MSRVIRKKVKGAPEMAWVALELIKTDLVTRNEHLEATNDYLSSQLLEAQTAVDELREIVVFLELSHAPDLLIRIRSLMDDLEMSRHFTNALHTRVAERDAKIEELTRDKNDLQHASIQTVEMLSHPDSDSDGDTNGSGPLV